MEQIGYLKKLATKTGSGKRGPWTAYSGKMEKADGTEYQEWISFGFDKPNVQEGGYYKITTDKDAKGYEKVSKIEAAEPPKKAHQAATQAVRGTPTSSTQEFIHYQSARSNALAFVELAVKLDALPLIQTKGKAGEAKRFDEIQALVDKLTVQFFYDTNTLRLLSSVEDAGAAEAAKDEEEDEEPAPGDDE